MYCGALCCACVGCSASTALATASGGIQLVKGGMTFSSALLHREAPASVCVLAIIPCFRCAAKHGWPHAFTTRHHHNTNPNFCLLCVVFLFSYLECQPPYRLHLLWRHKWPSRRWFRAAAAWSLRGFVVAKGQWHELSIGASDAPPDPPERDSPLCDDWPMT